MGLCLSSGALLARATGTLWDSEIGLFHSLLSNLKRGDIVVGDRGFGNFVMVALLATVGVDIIGRVPTNIRRVDFRAGRRLGRYDRLVRWRKGPRQGKGLSAGDWAALPGLLEVRIVRTQVRQRGFRSREITLVTTLLDAQLYPAQELLAAYARRWRLELCLDDLKTTLGLETLKCLSPASSSTPRPSASECAQIPREQSAPYLSAIHPEGVASKPGELIQRFQRWGIHVEHYPRVARFARNPGLKDAIPSG